MTWYIIGGTLLLLLITYTIVIYNKLIRKRNKVKDQWAQIDVQLKRRFDLIPNLVEVVKGYAKHESETLENVVKARNMFTSSKSLEDEIKASSELTKALNKMMLLVESYPELKADTNFLNLQENLTQVEEKIAYSRQFYNDRVLGYLNVVEQFPSNIIAKIFKFKKISYFEIEKLEKEKPEIKF